MAVARVAAAQMITPSAPALKSTQDEHGFTRQEHGTRMILTSAG